MRRLVVALFAVGFVAAGCTPTNPPPSTTPQPALLAIAYSDLDGVNGYQPTGSDVMISKSVGDTVVSNVYPTRREGGTYLPFAAQGYSENVVDEVFRADATDIQLSVRAAAAGVNEIRFSSPGWKHELKYMGDTLGQWYDVISGTSPRDNVRPFSSEWDYVLDTTDNTFVDVEILT